MTAGREKARREGLGRCPCRGKGGPGQQHQESPPSSRKSGAPGLLNSSEVREGYPGLAVGNTPGHGRDGAPSALLPAQAAAGQGGAKDDTDTRAGCADPAGLSAGIPLPGLSSTIPDFISTAGSVLKGKVFHLCAMSPWESKAPGLCLSNSKRHFLVWFWLTEAGCRTLRNWNQ